MKGSEIINAKFVNFLIFYSENIYKRFQVFKMFELLNRSFYEAAFDGPRLEHVLEQACQRCNFVD